MVAGRYVYFAFAGAFAPSATRKYLSCWIDNRQFHQVESSLPAAHPRLNNTLTPFIFLRKFVCVSPELKAGTHASFSTDKIAHHARGDRGCSADDGSGLGSRRRAAAQWSSPRRTMGHPVCRTAFIDSGAAAGRTSPVASSLRKNQRSLGLAVPRALRFHLWDRIDRLRADAHGLSGIYTVSDFTVRPLHRGGRSAGEGQPARLAGAEHEHSGRRYSYRQHSGNDRRRHAADPPDHPRQRQPSAQRSCDHFLHLPRGQHRRLVDAPRRPAAVPRVPEGREFFLAGTPSPRPYATARGDPAGGVLCARLVPVPCRRALSTEARPDTGQPSADRGPAQCRAACRDRPGRPAERRLEAGHQPSPSIISSSNCRTSFATFCFC